MLLVQRLGASLVNRRAGLAAAIFVAAAPLSVRDLALHQARRVRDDADRGGLRRDCARMAGAARRWPPPSRRDHCRCGMRRRVFDSLLLCVPRAAAGLGGRSGMAFTGRRRVATELVIAGVCSAARLLCALALYRGRADHRMARHHCKPSHRRRSRGTLAQWPRRSDISTCSGATRWAYPSSCSAPWE